MIDGAPRKRRRNNVCAPTPAPEIATTLPADIRVCIPIPFLLFGWMFPAQVEKAKAQDTVGVNPAALRK